jgi:hypothetical protein
MPACLGHLNVDHPDTAAWPLGEVGYLDDFVVNDLLADETRPRILSVDYASFITTLIGLLSGVIMPVVLIGDMLGFACSMTQYHDTD